MEKLDEDCEMAKVEIPGWKCERCGHVWVSRQERADEPRVCPKCKSPYWNKPRQKPKTDDRKKDAEE